MQNNTVKSVYIHIPFCKNICSYCDFCKNLYNENIVLKYLDSLEKEINNNYKNEEIKTLYIGGGTPSSLSLNTLIKLFNILENIKLCDNYEFTFECNYEDITEELLVLLKDNKVNRISIGLQTFNKKFESILNRKVNKDKMIEKVNLSKKYFENINVDLMYGFNNESLEELETDLNEFLTLDITHISCYSLILEENTKLFIKDYEPVEEELETNMYYKIISVLKEHGYLHYELSNFSKKGYESKHNLTYWNNEEYYGFGAGASGFINNIRYDNTKSVPNYINGKTKVYEEKITRMQSIKDEVMLNLRKTKGINKEEFKDKYKIDIYDAFDIKTLTNDNLLIDISENIFIPEDKLFISNYIIIKLFDNFIIK